ncbi:tyrosine-protein phosphatase [Parafrankia discariae]|uniref:tyrosine-protein phosphatase n=1 Tax=Parafrankia discariae TaxID=365528 RepID=UPI0004784434|nr:tyrosine-protein phosphatase [Parafrankia discariae]
MTTEPGPGGGGSRLVRLEGAVNVRDLGGYPTADGGRVRWGRVYRSAALHRLTAADLTAVERLGLRVVYDLRTDAEIELAPSLLPGGVRRERLAIGGSAARNKDLTDLVVAGRLAEVPPDFLTRVYDAMAETGAAAFGRLLTGLAEPDATPALFHCTAGKDRTGVAAALLLSLLGVDESLILDDFELSTVHYTDPKMARLRRRLAGTDVDVEHYRVVFGAPRQALSTLLATLTERHGSVPGYLEEVAGIAPDLPARLRAQLVEPPGQE